MHVDWNCSSVKKQHHVQLSLQFFSWLGVFELRCFGVSEVQNFACMKTLTAQIKLIDNKIVKVVWSCLFCVTENFDKNNFQCFVYVAGQLWWAKKFETI